MKIVELKKGELPPRTLQSFYPPKTFTFLEWHRMPRASSRRIAKRNNPDVERPIYRAEDGETFVCPYIWRKSQEAVNEPN